MNHLIAAPLFFSLGALLSWMFFAWKDDREKSKYFRMYLDMMDDRDRLAEDNYHLKRENEKLKSALIKNRRIFSSKKQQEKEKCST